jgi:hypothetical protein
MFPTLRHIPPRAITRIPGPPRLGSRRALVTFGVFYDVVTVGGHGGMPTGDMVGNFVASTPSGVEPVWFAVSDGGAGFIPWGSWQVAVYLTGTPYPPSTNFAFRWTTASPGDGGASVAARVATEFETLRAQAISAGYGNSSKITFEEQYFDLGGAHPSGSLRVRAPYGAYLSLFYSGPFYAVGEAPVPMTGLTPGYDNPLFMALWAPGSRAVLPAQDRSLPRRYPGYPYPYPPYHGPPIVG